MAMGSYALQMKTLSLQGLIHSDKLALVTDSFEDAVVDRQS